MMICQRLTFHLFLWMIQKSVSIKKSKPTKSEYSSCSIIVNSAEL